MKKDPRNMPGYRPNIVRDFVIRLAQAKNEDEVAKIIQDFKNTNPESLREGFQAIELEIKFRLFRLGSRMRALGGQIIERLKNG